MLKFKALFIAGLVLAFTTTLSAQSNFVGQFLNRYKPPKIDLPGASTGQVSDEPWHLMVRQGSLPISISDIIRLMLASNLDVTVNRYSPLTTEYLLNTLYRPFEPTLRISAQAIRSTTPSASQLQSASALSQLLHQYSIGYGQTLQNGTQVGVAFNMNRSSSNNPFSTFNPSYSGNITYSVSQPLLQNYGRA